MTLREWREFNHLSLESAAIVLDAANGSVVSKWELGICIPRRDQMRTIWIKTGGRVDANSFYDLPALPLSEAA